MKEKKYIVISILFLIGLVCNIQAFDVPLENAGFELPGDGKIKGWDLDDGAYYDIDSSPAEVPGWESDGIIEDSGVENAYVSPTGEKWRGFFYNQDSSAYNFSDFAITINRTYTLHFETNGFEDDTDSIQASLIYGNPLSRNVIVSEMFPPSEDWESFSLSFSSNDFPGAVGGIIGVEFLNTTDSELDSWIGIDNVRIEASDFVTLISPAPSGVRDLDISGLVLEWTVDNGWPCNVYFGTNPDVKSNPKIISNQVASSYALGTLGYATKHYWMVETIDIAHGNVAQIGPTWEFRTISDIPDIIEQPKSAVVFAGDPVEFTVSTISAFMPHDFQWYEQGAIVLTDGTKYNGTTTETLTVYDAQETDPNYYCEITNSEGSVTTDFVGIFIKKLLSHYKFDGDLTDEMGGYDGEAKSGKVSYVPGVDDLAVEGDKNIYVEISADAYPKAGVGNGLEAGTVSCWVKIGFIGDEYAMFGNINSSGTGIMLRSPIGENDFIGLAGFYLCDDSNRSVTLTSTEMVCDNQWHHLAITYDTVETDTFRLYVDGVMVDEEVVFGIGDFADWSRPTAILAAMDSGSVGRNFAEPLDDLRFYNFAMTKVEIAQLYYDISGIELCALEYPVDYDLSGPEGEPDCSFDLYDIADMFSAWLECGMYPDCPPL